MQSVEHAVESTVAKDVPGLEIEVDPSDVMAKTAKRRFNLGAGPQRYIALGGSSAAEDR
jgi:hypothetical protein